MSIDAQVQLVVAIEELLAFADRTGQVEVAIRLDQARVAAGGEPGFAPEWIELPEGACSELIFAADTVGAGEPLSQ